MSPIETALNQMTIGEVKSVAAGILVERTSKELWSLQPNRHMTFDQLIHHISSLSSSDPKE